MPNLLAWFSKTHTNKKDRYNNQNSIKNVNKMPREPVIMRILVKIKFNYQVYEISFLYKRNSYKFHAISLVFEME